MLPRRVGRPVRQALDSSQYVPTDSSLGPPTGRFAPTPSGPLHRGSLLTALGGWLHVRRRGGRWWLRMDDLDTPRCVPGADLQIQHQLLAHGLAWDGTVVYQSLHLDDYAAALNRLMHSGRLYACRCTRAVLAATARPGPDGTVYSGRCRHAAWPLDEPCMLRFALDDEAVRWQDAVLGPVSRRAAEVGDFPVRRADGQIGYHLACVVDEARMGITDVMRGADLIAASAQQQWLMTALGHPRPRYGHLPLLCAADGRKLSKQNGAAAIGTRAGEVVAQLGDALRQLGYVLPEPGALPSRPRDWLDWALQQPEPAPPPSARAPAVCATRSHLACFDAVQHPIPDSFRSRPDE